MSFRCRLAIHILLTAAFIGAASAQNTTTLPVTISVKGTANPSGGAAPLTGTGTVSPYGTVSVSGNVDVGVNPATLSLTFSLDSGDSFVATDSNGNVLADSAFAATSVGTATISAGTGKFAGATGSFSYTFQGGGAPGVDTWSLTGSGKFTTAATLSPCPLQLNTSSLTLSALPGVPTPQAGFVLEANQTTLCSVAPVAFSASASTSDGQNWLTVTPASGTATPPVAITVAANANGLTPGIYQGTVTVTQGSTTLSLAVEFTVSAQDLLNISQSGLVFEVAAGTVALPSQSISVSEAGSSGLTYSVSTQTLSGGPWLTATPTSGTANPGATSTVDVSVNSSGLAAGDYYGLVQFSAKGAGNTPQSSEVTLRVLPSTSSPEPVISPAGVAFVVGPGSAAAQQSVQVFNPTNQSITVSAVLTFPGKAGWVTVSPGGTVASGQSLTLNLQVPPPNLLPGMYAATLNIQTSIDPSVHPVGILLLLLSTPPPAPAISSGEEHRGKRPDATCTPTQLLPVFTLLGNTFQTPAGWPVSLQAQVLDDCGNPLTNGSVVASFSTGDAPLSMVSLGAGNWSGTWQPHDTTGGPATVTVNATSFNPVLAGSAVISGMLSPNPAVPSVDPGGVVSTASFQPNTPVSPGSFVSIFGTNLAPQLAGSNTLPYPPTLANTEVVLGGEALPLEFVAGGQVNGIIPYDVGVNAAQQLIVQQGNSYSLPQPVLVAAAQPAIFTQNESGMGQGVIVVLKSNGTEFETSPTAPASAGDVLIIYCSGLGAVAPPVPAGTAGPLNPLSNTVNTVTATVGDLPAKVIFAGLAPGFAGLYQVNAVVPSGITPSTAVPVVLTVAGQSSVPVTVSIH